MVCHWFKLWSSGKENTAKIKEDKGKHLKPSSQTTTKQTLLFTQHLLSFPYFNWVHTYQLQPLQPTMSLLMSTNYSLKYATCARLLKSPLSMISQKVLPLQAMWSKLIALKITAVRDNSRAVNNFLIIFFCFYPYHKKHTQMRQTLIMRFWGNRWLYGVISGHKATFHLTHILHSQPSTTPPFPHLWHSLVFYSSTIPSMALFGLNSSLMN